MTSGVCNSPSKCLEQKLCIEVPSLMLMMMILGKLLYVMITKTTGGTKKIHSLLISGSNGEKPSPPVASCVSLSFFLVYI